MKFVLISDIHVDLHPLDMTELSILSRSVDTLVVAGDIANDVMHTCRWLKEAKSLFKQVIWVAGNHDFYNALFHTTKLYNPEWPTPRSVPEMLDHYQRWSQENNIVFLNRSSFDYENVTFIGTTGWHDFVAGEPFTSYSQIDAWYKVLSDTRIIWHNDQKSADHNWPLNAAIEDAAWLRSSVSNSVNKCVVITHHIPHRALKWEQPHDSTWTKLHGCFVNTACEDIVSDKIALWCYGHTHQRGLKTINGIDYICNSRGYKHENSSWEPIVLEI